MVISIIMKYNISMTVLSANVPNKQFSKMTVENGSGYSNNQYNHWTGLDWTNELQLN